MSDLSAQIRVFDQNICCNVDQIVRCYSLFWLHCVTLLLEGLNLLCAEVTEDHKTMWGVDHDIQKNSEASANAAQKSDNLRVVKNQMKPRSP